MTGKRFLFLSKLFLILILTGNIVPAAQNGDVPRSSGCGKSKTDANVSNTNINVSNTSANNSNTSANISKPNTNVSVTAANDLDARRWNLVELNGAKIESSKAFVEFASAENRVTGNAGCNRMFGKFETNAGDIKISGIGATKMFCAQEGVMKLETDFTKALERATRFEQQGSTLNLYAGNDLILKFAVAAKDTTPGSENSGVIKLEDKKWILTAINGKALPAPLKATPFLVFNAQRQSAGGNSGCNSFGGSYKTGEHKISVTEIISTQIACIEDERMNIERDFFSNLKKAGRFEIKNNKLHLLQNDTLLLTFDGR